jgi:hypothetical protein
MSCCEWEVFENGLIRVFEHAKIDTVLIDWPVARTAWKRHHAMPGEVGRAMIGEIKSGGDYLFALPRRKAR